MYPRISKVSSVWIGEAFVIVIIVILSSIFYEFHYMASVKHFLTMRAECKKVKRFVRGQLDGNVIRARYLTTKEYLCVMVVYSFRKCAVPKVLASINPVFIIPQERPADHARGTTRTLLVDAILTLWPLFPFGVVGGTVVYLHTKIPYHVGGVLYYCL